MHPLICSFVTTGIIAFVSAFACEAADVTVIPELALDHAWSVDYPQRWDGSGLAVRDGVFFAVSDKHDHAIFRLEFSADVVRPVVAITFAGPNPYPAGGILDIEGIAPAPEGGFYISPEDGFGAVLVPADGGRAIWVTPDIRASGEAVGLFARDNAYVEGIAILGDNHFILAAEREPRGLIEISGGASDLRIAVQKMETSRFPSPPKRRLDFADLTVWHGRLFALARNQHLLVELRRNAAGAWGERAAWSYAATENAPEHRFTDMTFGMGEGLAIDEKRIYVLLDTNAQGRATNPDDRRSWLFAFQNVIDP